MVRLTADLVAKSIVARKNRGEEDSRQCLRKMTHLNLSNKNIDVIVRWTFLHPFQPGHSRVPRLLLRRAVCSWGGEPARRGFWFEQLSGGLTVTLTHRSALTTADELQHSLPLRRGTGLSGQVWKWALNVGDLSTVACRIEHQSRCLSLVQSAAFLVMKPTLLYVEKILLRYFI